MFNHDVWSGQWSERCKRQRPGHGEPGNLTKPKPSGPARSRGPRSKL